MFLLQHALSPLFLSFFLSHFLFLFLFLLVSLSFPRAPLSSRICQTAARLLLDFSQAAAAARQLLHDF